MGQAGARTAKRPRKQPEEKKKKPNQSPAEHNLGAEQGEKQASQSSVDDKESPRETEGILLTAKNAAERC